MFKRFFLPLLLLFAFTIQKLSYAELVLKPNAPAKYIIQPNDTLWSIACQYLENPWQWPELYNLNPSLSHNPNQLYAGDVLFLKIKEGRARLSREQKGVLKLSPSMREQPLDQPIPTIPYDEIKPFLTGIRIVDAATAAQSSYVLAIKGESRLGTYGTEIYAKNLNHPRYRDYFVYRQEAPLLDPTSKRLIGYETKFVANARLLRYHNDAPAVLTITDSKEEVEPGDRISPVPPLTKTDDILIRTPRVPMVGQIIKAISEDSQFGQYQIAIINRGLCEELRIGDVLAIYRKGSQVPDPMDPSYKQYHKKHWLQLPNERIGELMVFKLFDHASLGLILNSKEEIQNLDYVTNPE